MASFLPSPSPAALFPSPSDPWSFPFSFDTDTLPEDATTFHTELILSVHVVDRLQAFTIYNLPVPLPESLLSDALLTLADANPLSFFLRNPLSPFLCLPPPSVPEVLLKFFLEKISLLYQALDFLPNPHPDAIWLRASAWAFSLLDGRLSTRTTELAHSGVLDYSSLLPEVLDWSAFSNKPYKLIHPTPASLHPQPPVDPQPPSNNRDPGVSLCPHGPSPIARGTPLPSPHDVPSKPSNSGSHPRPAPTRPKVEAQLGNTIINLTKTFKLSNGQTNLLDKGLTFIPSAEVESKEIWRTLELETHKYHRRLRLASAFDSSKEDETWREDPRKRFVPPSTWQPPFTSLPTQLQLLIRKDLQTLAKLRNTRYKDPEPNVTHQEMQELREPSKNRHLVFKPADKGTAIVIQDREDYVWEAQRQLDMLEYYRPLEEPIGPSTARRIRDILDRLVEGGYITSTNRHVLQGETPHKARTIYFLPKIHKKPESWPKPGRIPAGRPIVSDCGSETYVIAEYLDLYLNPLSHRHPSYVKDTYDFLTKVREAHVNPGDFIFSMDVDALYTNIETGPGLAAIRRCFEKYPDPKRPDDLLLELLEVSLTTNDFVFDGRRYLQIKGVAMGKKFAPALADIYMAEWEETILAECPLKPSYYFRYLDDIWGIWPYSREEFAEFVAILNKHHRSISLKYELNQETMDFLDTTTFKGPNFANTHRLDTKVFFKGTDTHALLHGTSYHPRHTFKGLVKSQLIRFRRICSRDEDFHEATGLLFAVLRTRGYTLTLLRQTRRTFLQRKPPSEAKMLPLIANYGPRAASLNTAYKRNFQQCLTGMEEAQFWKPIASYKRNPNLKNLLVRSKLAPLEDPGPPKAPETRFFRRPVFARGGDTRTTTNPRRTSLDTRNCVYLLRCRHCGQGYVGETGGTLRARLYQHLWNISSNRHLHTTLIKHFRKHGQEQLKATVLEHNRSWNVRRRRKREYSWIQFLGTQEPGGFNQRTYRQDPPSQD